MYCMPNISGNLVHLGSFWVEFFPTLFPLPLAVLREQGGYHGYHLETNGRNDKMLKSSDGKNGVQTFTTSNYYHTSMF